MNLYLTVIILISAAVVYEQKLKDQKKFCAFWSCINTNTQWNAKRYHKRYQVKRVGWGEGAGASIYDVSCETSYSGTLFAQILHVCGFLGVESSKLKRKQSSVIIITLSNIGIKSRNANEAEALRV